MKHLFTIPRLLAIILISIGTFQLYSNLYIQMSWHKTMGIVQEVKTKEISY